MEAAVSRVDLSKHLSTFIYVIFFSLSLRSRLTLNYLYRVVANIHLLPLACVPSNCAFHLFEDSAVGEGERTRNEDHKKSGGWLVTLRVHKK